MLGTGETCNGDSARRSGNEFLFQQLAQQAVETLDGLFEGVETVDRKIVVTCPHCFNTLGREYRQLGANYTVLHHTQLLNGWSGTRSWSRSSRSTATAADRRSPTTTRVTWADTTRFTKRRVS
ncbi:cysteine-rich domain protein [Mycobacterium xenopi 3993]|nr:cysteine-rich domain protein [Mycobacterium xenopi 3993]